MTGYGPPEDPYYSEHPTEYIGPPGGPPVPWYRKPWAFVLFGALGALLLALIIWLIFGGSNPNRNEPLAPLSTTSRTATTTSTPPPSTSETTQPTTTTTTPSTTTTTESTTPATTSTTSTTVTITVSTSTVTVTVPGIPGLPPP